MMVPMLSAGKVLKQKVASLYVEPPNVAKPALKSAPAPKPVTASRLNAFWAVARTLPPDCRTAIKDAWSFSKETRAGADAIVGIARVAEPAFLA